MDDSERAARIHLVQQAEEWIGTSYLPGGRTRAGVDAAGFLVGLLRGAGWALPLRLRTPETLRQWCVPLDAWELAEPGDLVFFHDTAPRGADLPGPDGQVASHVGLSYGQGTRTMLDAQRAHLGVGSTLLDSAWEAHWLEARRLPMFAAWQPRAARPARVPVTRGTPPGVGVRDAVLAVLLAEDGELRQRLLTLRSTVRYGGARAQLDLVLARLATLHDEIYDVEPRLEETDVYAD